MIITRVCERAPTASWTITQEAFLRLDAECRAVTEAWHGPEGQSEEARRRLLGALRRVHDRATEVVTEGSLLEPALLTELAMLEHALVAAERGDARFVAGRGVRSYREVWAELSARVERVAPDPAPRVEP